MQHSVTRFQSGSSVCVDGVAAACAAVEAALSGRTSADGDLIMLFVSTTYDDMDAVHQAAIAAAGDAQVVGCSVSYAGAFTDTNGTAPGVVATHIPAAGTSFGVVFEPSLGDDLALVARRAAERACTLAGERFAHSALLMLSDGLAGDQRELIRGAYDVTGAKIPIVGGAAADNGFTRTYQFAVGGTSHNGLIAIWINSPTPIAVSVRHGWHAVGKPLIVTRAKGAVIYELDGRPALEAYMEQRRADPDLDQSSTYAQMMDAPLGLPNSSGNYDIRHVAHSADGALEMFSYVPEQAIVQVMAGDCDQLLDGARAASVDAARQLQGDARGALVFSCSARVNLLGDRLDEENDGVSCALGGAPTSGFFTYGEFARVPGSTGLHNGSVAVLAL